MASSGSVRNSTNNTRTPSNTGHQVPIVELLPEKWHSDYVRACGGQHRQNSSQEMGKRTATSEVVSEGTRPGSTTWAPTGGLAHLSCAFLSFT